jgi:hypothetical protein
MIYMINKGYYSPVLLEIIPLNLLEKETICVPSALVLVFDTSHDKLTGVPPGSSVMCYIYKRAVDKKKEKTIWSLGA